MVYCLRYIWCLFSIIIAPHRIYIPIFVSSLSSPVKGYIFPKKMYSCHNNSCKLFTNIDNQPRTDRNLTSQSVCLITCGSGYYIWPKPTGKVHVSSSYEYFLLRDITVSFDSKRIEEDFSNIFIDIIRDLIPKGWNQNTITSSNKYQKINLIFTVKDSSVTSPNIDNDEGYILDITKAKTAVEVLSTTNFIKYRNNNLLISLG